LGVIVAESLEYESGIALPRFGVGFRPILLLLAHLSWFRTNHVAVGPSSLGFDQPRSGWLILF
jgi:hypothetical protein